MSDEPIEVTPLHFTQYVALAVDVWPEQTVLDDEWLARAYQYGATVDGDTIRFVIGNGEATYSIDRSKKYGHGFVASLVEGNAPANLKSRKAKYETKASP
jgi:hypothetical protein